MIAIVAAEPHPPQLHSLLTPFIKMATGVARLGLCGFGRAGLFHFTSIRGNPRVALSHVIEDEPRLESVRETLSKHNLDHVTVSSPKDFQEKVLSDPQVDALVVATPTDTHEWYVQESLRAGKHVFCEKPVADSLEIIQSCYKQASQSNLHLFCGFNRRFDSGFYDAWTRLREGEIGRVYTIKTTSRDHPSPPIEYLLSSKGISHDSAIHDIDMICWMIGEEPIEVYAQGQAHNPRLQGIDVDVISITLKFSSGTIGNIEVSRYSTAGYDQRLEVRERVGCS